MRLSDWNRRCDELDPERARQIEWMIKRGRRDLAAVATAASTHVSPARRVSEAAIGTTDAPTTRTEVRTPTRALRADNRTAALVARRTTVVPPSL